MAQGEPKFYAHMLDAAQKMYRTEGFFSFYKGVVPTLAQMAPQAGIQFTVYTLFVRLIRVLFGFREFDERSGKKMRPGAAVSLVAGVGAGITAKFVVFPFDLLKKRMQVRQRRVCKVFRVLVSF